MLWWLELVSKKKIPGQGKWAVRRWGRVDGVVAAEARCWVRGFILYCVFLCRLCVRACTYRTVCVCVHACVHRLANLSALCVFQMPDHFDQAVVLNQLRYSGMLETVRIRKAGYAVRRPFQDFYKRQDQRLRTSSFSSEGWGKRGSDGKT